MNEDNTVIELARVHSTSPIGSPEGASVGPASRGNGSDTHTRLPLQTTHPLWKDGKYDVLKIRGKYKELFDTGRVKTVKEFAALMDLKYDTVRGWIKKQGWESDLEKIPEKLEELDQEIDLIEQERQRAQVLKISGNLLRKFEALSKRNLRPSDFDKLTRSLAKVNEILLPASGKKSTVAEGRIMEVTFNYNVKSAAYAKPERETEGSVVSSYAPVGKTSQRASGTLQSDRRGKANPQDGLCFEVVRDGTDIPAPDVGSGVCGTDVQAGEDGGLEKGLEHISPSERLAPGGEPELE